MARYTSLFKIAASVTGLQPLLCEVLKSCNFDVVYQSGDYLMAREVPGKVAYHQLVTVEVLIDKTTAAEDQFRMSLVVKNEELPLRVDNHCHRVFDQVHQAISDTRDWQLIEAVAN